MIIKKFFNCLKQEIPLETIKLQLHFKSMDDSVGSCSPPSKSGIVKISLDNKQSLHNMIDTLIHEYAHAMMMNKKKVNYNYPHSNEWGKCYAKAYRCALRHF